MMCIYSIARADLLPFASCQQMLRAIALPPARSGWMNPLTMGGPYGTKTQSKEFAPPPRSTGQLRRATSSVDRALVSGTKGPGFDPRVARQEKSRT